MVFVYLDHNRYSKLSSSLGYTGIAGYPMYKSIENKLNRVNFLTLVSIFILYPVLEYCMESDIGIALGYKLVTYLVIILMLAYLLCFTDRRTVDFKREYNPMVGGSLGGVKTSCNSEDFWKEVMGTDSPTEDFSEDFKEVNINYENSQKEDYKEVIKEEKNERVYN